jgi:hypothetical protein
MNSFLHACQEIHMFKAMFGNDIEIVLKKY